MVPEPNQIFECTVPYCTYTLTPAFDITHYLRVRPSVRIRLLNIYDTLCEKCNSTPCGCNPVQIIGLVIGTTRRGRNDDILGMVIIYLLIFKGNVRREKQASKVRSFLKTSCSFFMIYAAIILKGPSRQIRSA
jgi:hypothetical protein